MKMFNFYCLFIIFLSLFHCIDAKKYNSVWVASNNKAGEHMVSKKEVSVKKKVLSNGLTVLVREVHNIPKVSIQLFYKVGSKDERTKEKGIAHLIEHMVFKGTEKASEKEKENLAKKEKESLSEVDINFLTNKLSGDCNAFTSYDYTGYLFNFPTHHWKEALPVMADCMLNCAFKDDHLNSELKAVIQELKMYNDHFFRKLFTHMMSSIFLDHPYRNPVIGYKQDVWEVKGNDLKKFYKKHYVPNNATLVVVGDVNANEVFDLAQKYFGAIPVGKDYKKEKFYLNEDIAAKSVVMQRDIKQPLVMLGYVIPGMEEKIDHILDVLELVLGKGKGSRLYRKVVDEKQLATSFESDSLRLFDHGLFLIWFEPKDIKDVNKIEKIIQNEIASIVDKGLSDREIERAVNQSKMAYYSKLENMQSQGYDIGKYFLATGDENYALTYLDRFEGDIKANIQNLLAQYFRPAITHKGVVLPLDVKEKVEWNKIQSRSDKKDSEVLSERVRNTVIEKPRYALTVEIKEAERFGFPKSKTFMLSNGVKVLYCNNPNTPKVNLILELRAKSFYDPQDMQGLYNFVASVLTEGTRKYTAAELADEIETRGMSLSVSPGYVSMSMLRSDLPKGIELLEEILSNPRFDENEIEKTRAQLLTDVKNFWDDQGSITGQLLKENIYKGHPYSKNVIGTKESIQKIKKGDLIAFYKKYISPSGAKFSIVGDLPPESELKTILEGKLAKWKGPEVKEMVFPKLETTAKESVDFYINRDQLYLAMANLSVDRNNDNYDKLVLFDQIFGGGALHNMYSKLFQIREQTGLFYKIFGSLTQNSGEQPGIVLIQGVVSLDRLHEAEDIIKETIDSAADSLKKEELDQAKRAVSSALINNFETNRRIALAFLFLDKYGFAKDYFDNRAAQLEGISPDEVKAAVKNVLHSDSMITLRVGRIGKENKA